MVSVRNVTGRTSQSLPAFSAGNKCGISPSIQEKHGLLSFFQIFPDCLLQRQSKGGAIAILQLLPHIRHKYLWQVAALCPFFQLQQQKFSCHCPMITVDVRGSTAHNQQCSCQFRQLSCHFAGMILGCYIGNVTAFVTLIHDNDPKIGERHKQCGTWSNDDGNFSVPRLSPLVQTFSQRKAAMGHRNSLAKTRNKPLHNLGSQ